MVIKKAAAEADVERRGGVYNGRAFAATATVAGVDSTPSSSLEGVGLTLRYYLGTATTGTFLSGAPWSAGTYTVVASFAGSTDYTAASRSLAFSIKKAMPALSQLASPTITQGTATTVLSGTISLGGLIPTGTVTITVGGVSMTAQIEADGSFSVSFATAPLAIGKHSITYNYAGDDNFNSISGKGTLTVTV